MKPKPLFSIILPTRDRPNLVSRVLESLAAQTFTDFEVIVSDNAVNSPCLTEVARFLGDKRFHYKKPSQPMDMCKHWDFALEGANGQYITVFSEKFILRPDALALMAKEIMRSKPDVLTWQYEVFDVRFSDGSNFYGDYHPLIKPGRPINYDPVSELTRRFQFNFPLFCRQNKPKDNYGKIYSGAVNRDILARIKTNYGRIFHPLSPDFTSMVAILNESKICIDMNQGLMLLINIAGVSNGEATKASVNFTRHSFESFGLDVNNHGQRLPIPGFWVGHHVNIAADFELIRTLADDGPVKGMEIDKGALAFWAELDLGYIKDWQSNELEAFQSLLGLFLGNLDSERRQELEQNLKTSIKPSINEIYHSGLKQTEHLNADTTAEQLANIHWLDNLAPPRKPVNTVPMELVEALDYFYQYNQHSSRLLALSEEG
jgi:hypothetical protein